MRTWLKSVVAVVVVVGWAAQARANEVLIGAGWTYQQTVADTENRTLAGVGGWNARLGYLWDHTAYDLVAEVTAGQQAMPGVTDGGHVQASWAGAGARLRLPLPFNPTPFVQVGACMIEDQPAGALTRITVDPGLLARAGVAAELYELLFVRLGAHVAGTAAITPELPRTLWLEAGLDLTLAF